MSAKYFCDCCKAEITAGNRITNSPNMPAINPPTLGAVNYKQKDLIVSCQPVVLDKNAGQGDWCKYCILDTIAQLDDRAKPS